MAGKTTDEDMIGGVIGFVLVMIFQAIKGLLYILFISPSIFWGFFNRRFGWKVSLIAVVGIAGVVVEIMLLRNMWPYGLVDYYIHARAWHGLARYVAYYVVSWILISPFYILFHIWHQAKDEKRAGQSLVFGRSVTSKRTIMIPDAKRTEHILALGSTGTGKTTSVIEPAIQSDIVKGRGLLFMTAKDDPAFVERVYSFAQACGRGGDVRIFTLSDSLRTDSYNPLMGGDAMALRDLCMESFTWDNPYYRDQARSALLYVLSALVETRKKFSLKDLYYIFTQKGCLDALVEQIEDSRTIQHLRSYSEDWKQHRENNRGLAANLEDYTTERLAPKICAYNPDINLAHSYANNHILLFVLNSMQYGNTARRLGRMIVQNLRYLSGLIAEAGSEKFYPVYIDEFHHFIFPEFFSVVAQCRSSQIGLMLSTQSFADLSGDGWDITTQVVQNTNTKIILRQNDSQSAEIAARLAGTRTVVKRTRQVENAMFTVVDTGLGSEREVEEFVIHPNKIRSLPTGRAAIIHEGAADVIDLNRAWMELPQHNPNDRAAISQNEDRQEGIDIYACWMAAEEAKKGEGIRRPAVHEPKKDVKGIDAIRARIKP